MQTLKTALIVVLLMAMLIGVYTVLNTPPAPPPRELIGRGTDLLQVEEGEPDSLVSPNADAADSIASTTGKTGRPGRLAAPRPLTDIVERPGVGLEPRQPGDNSPTFVGAEEPLNPVSPPDLATPSERVAQSDAGGYAGVAGRERPAPRSGNSTVSSGAAQPRPARPSSLPPLNRSAPGPGSSGSAPSLPVPSLPPPSLPPPSLQVPATTDADRVEGNGAGAIRSSSPGVNEGASGGWRSPAGSGAAPAAAPRVPAGGPVGVGAYADARSRPAATATGISAAAGAATNGFTGAAAPANRYVEGIRFDPKEASFARAMQAAKAQMEEKKWRDALSTLTTTYEDPRLSDAERQQLLDRLDPLAAKVVYSTENLLEPPYEPRRGETLMSIAQQYQVPWQLLQKINGVRNPEFLPPGTRLKVIRGPFRGEVDLQRQELTLYLNRLYAGRFPISFGNPPEPGEYSVKVKETGRTFFTSDSRPIHAADPANPFGQIWMDLGRNVAIHGSPLKPDPALDPGATGSISLSPRDADDVFAILSTGSAITIRR
ncbi:MAG: LysM peptidoglycan-binding domain-containing protein [Planctomycetota bacterium]